MWEKSRVTDYSGLIVIEAETIASELVEGLQTDTDAEAQRFLEKISRYQSSIQEADPAENATYLHILIKLKAAGKAHRKSFNRLSSVLADSAANQLPESNRMGSLRCSIEIGKLLCNLGVDFLKLRDLSRSRNCLQKAIAIYERLVKEGHLEIEPDLARSYNNLGATLQKMRALPGSRDYHQRAISIYERLVKEGHPELEPDLAGSYNKLGATLHKMRDLPGSCNCIQKAIAIHERLVKEGHPEIEPDLATSYNHLGCTLHLMRDLPGSRDCYQKAISIRELLVKEGHPELEPDLAGYYSNLGLTLRELRDLLGSRDYHQRAISIRERLVKEGQLEIEPDLASSYTNLGNTLSGLRDLPGSRDCYQKAISIRERLVKEGHPEIEPDLATSYNNLGGTLHLMRDLTGSRHYHQRAISIRELLVKEGHLEIEPDLADSYSNLGITLRALRDLPGSYECFRVAVELVRRWVSERSAVWFEHRLAESWHELALSLFLLGRYGEAEDELFRIAEMLPHLVEVFENGIRLYQNMLSLSDLALKEGNLPREEVLSGIDDLLALKLRFHGGSWRGSIASAISMHFAFGQTDRAVQFIAEAVDSCRFSEPQVYLESSEFLIRIGRGEDSAVLAEKGVYVLCQHLEREQKGPRMRNDEEIIALLKMLMDIGEIAVKCCFDALEHTDAVAFAWRIREPVIVAFNTWQHLVGETLGRRSTDLQKALDEGHARSLKTVNLTEQYYRAILKPFLGDRFREVVRSLEVLAEGVAAGELNDDEAGRRVAELSCSLADTREISGHRDKCRSAVLKKLKINPAAAPELRFLVSALVLNEAKSLPDSVRPNIVLALLGTATEGVLAERLFKPYLVSVDDGDALPSPVVDFPRDRPFCLGEMCKPWGKLVKYWDSSEDVEGLARWVDKRLPNPCKLKNPNLNTLNRVRELRNKGPHFSLEGAKQDEVEEMLVLTVSGENPIVLSVYQAAV